MESPIAFFSQLLSRACLLEGGVKSCQQLSGDGSDRLFFRIHRRNAYPLIAALPDSLGPQGRAEAWASYQIGRHFMSARVPVPQVYGYDKVTSIVFFADLGDIHLQNRVIDEADQKIGLYKDVIDALLRLQIHSRTDFPVQCCWDTTHYDRKLMLERESGYFSRAFCHDFLGKVIPSGLSVEFQHLAERAGRQPADFVMHRDFQSRNVMVHENEIWIIDFQGARLGPLGYDIASLLIDPYIRLSAAEQELLQDYYFDQASIMMDLQRDFFFDGYYSLALQRNLQILGAFAFLSQNKGRHFFKKFIKPATCSLNHLLQHHFEHDYSVLARLVAEITKEIT